MAGFLDVGYLRYKGQQLSAVFWQYVPEALFLPGLYLTDPEEIEVSSLPISEAMLAKIKAASLSRGANIALLSEACLTKEVTLPKAALPHAAAALALHLRQTLPNGGKRVIWRSIKRSGTSESASFLVCILKQQQLDALVTALTLSGAKVASVRIKGSTGASLWTGSTNKDRVRAIGLAATVILALLPAALTTALSMRDLARVKDEALVTLERVEQLKEQLLAEKGTDGDFEARKQNLTEAIAAFNGQSWRLQMLADLTDALPDSVWISELTISEGRISLAGFSVGEISGVLAAVQSIPWVATAQLDGPVSVDAAAGESRFQMSVEVKNAAAPI
jgi:Tfp pilus assembly protein PilN